MSFLTWKNKDKYNLEFYAICLHLIYWSNKTKIIQWFVLNILKYQDIILKYF